MEPTLLPRDPALTTEAHALRGAFAPFATLAALHAAPEWPQWSARLEQLLSQVRQSTAALSTIPATRTLRVVHWNIEHGNRFEALRDALASHPDLTGADLITLNEVDLGMARSGNRDVAGELASTLGMHGVWAPMLLESTRGRDDDALTAVPEDNRESLFGLALLSRFPISRVRLVRLPGPAGTLFERERMMGGFVAIVADIAHPVSPFVAVTVHLEVHRTRAHRAQQMRLLLEALASESHPVVLAGDWNTHTFDRGTRFAVLSAAWPLLAWPADALAKRFRRPDRGPQAESLFTPLSQSGFVWEPYCDGEPTLGMRFSRLGEVHALPALLRMLVTRGLTWAERRARLRLDWIATRGCTPRSGATVQGLDGPGHASDHAPIIATLELP